MYQQWLAAIRIKNGQENVYEHTKYAVICSQHFTNECFEAFPQGFPKKLKPTSIPSIFPRNQEIKKKN